MLCKPSSRRFSFKRPHARPRANPQTAVPNSKPNRNCRSALVDHFSPCKTRPTNASATTKFERCYQSNQQYSITALTNGGGTITERYVYSAYGELTITDASGTLRNSTAEGNRYAYTGREWDDLAELYHYRARFYDPLSGRFCSRDPISIEERRPPITPMEFRMRVFTNLYRYVGGSPCVHLDPAGHDIWLPTEPITDTIDAVENLITETGTKGTPCNEWFQTLQAATACSAAWCTKSFFNAGEPSCADIFSETGSSLQHPFNACIHSLGNLHPRILLNIRTVIRKVQQECNNAAATSKCCKGGKIIPDPRPVTAEDFRDIPNCDLPDCTKIRMSCIRFRRGIRATPATAQRKQTLNSISSL